MFPPQRYQLKVCGGPRCSDRGSRRLRVECEAAVGRRGLAERVQVNQVVGVCHGRCGLGPNVFIAPGDVWYCGVTTSDVEEIIDEHIVRGTVVERLVGREPSFMQLDDRLPW